MSIKANSSAPTAHEPQARHQWPASLILVMLMQILMIALLIWSSEGVVRLLGGLLGFAAMGLSLWWGGQQNQKQTALKQVLQRMNGERMDLSRELDQVDGSGELGDHTQFTGRLRDLIVEFQQLSLRISLSSAASRVAAEKANQQASGQQNLAELIFSASDQSTTALQDITVRATTIADMNSRNLEVAKDSGQQLTDAQAQVQLINDNINRFQQTIARLDSSSSQIQSILGTVQDFSEQTNMLALNAAIEAARAGEQGRGFAVVADEVRNLSVRVGEAASQIGSLLQEMISAMAGAGEQTQDIIHQSAIAGQSVESAAFKFNSMVTDFSQAHDDLLMVSSSLEELAVTNTETHQHATEIRNRSVDIGDRMGSIFAATDTLRDDTNLVLQALCRFRLGEGQLEKVSQMLFERRDEFVTVLEGLLDRGVNIFDHNYRPIPNTNPQKHMVSWAEAYADKVRPMLDSWDKGGKDGVVYVAPTDINGYFAASRTASSQPMTGNPAVDAAQSTHQRFLVDKQELENLRKCTYLSMGTFVLPDGKTIVIVMYIPVYVRGKHWGVISAGIHPKALGL